jgi:hypothetical protein
MSKHRRRKVSKRESWQKRVTIIQNLLKMNATERQIKEYVSRWFKLSEEIRFIFRSPGNWEINNNELEILRINCRDPRDGTITMFWNYSITDKGNVYWTSSGKNELHKYGNEIFSKRFKGL